MRRILLSFTLFCSALAAILRLLAAVSRLSRFLEPQHIHMLRLVAVWGVAVVVLVIVSFPLLRWLFNRADEALTRLLLENPPRWLSLLRRGFKATAVDLFNRLDEKLSQKLFNQSGQPDQTER